MGLESLNLKFQSKENLRNIIERASNIINQDNMKYTIKKDDEYWIDLNLVDENILFLRITLSNPTETLLPALYNLLELLFDNTRGACLCEMTNKIELYSYNKETEKILEDIFLKLKEKFKSFYGDINAAIGSEEFFERLDSK
ncbi:hypothetical protein [Elizabethkingia anophelis]|uniref:hypothetical protein n=1 Tax=Elizabethkingia anophelis TaxID=1117645 RepID=UPI00320AADF2